MFSIREIINSLARLSNGREQPSTLDVKSGAQSRSYPVIWKKSSYVKSLVLQDIVQLGVDIEVDHHGENFYMVKLSIPEINVELIGAYSLPGPNEPEPLLVLHQKS
jgi:hypothetical protein